jgi:nucleoside-diphosphate-sugar epimerase
VNFTNFQSVLKYMKVAITGGTGFVGRHLAAALAEAGHEARLLARGEDRRDLAARELGEFIPAYVSRPDELAQAFTGCDAVAHLAGINREIGGQTYQAIHVEGTQNVVDAAKAAGVRKVILLSFLRARPDCGSAYHESKFAAEEIVRSSGLDYTIFKAGVIYGRGDHMLDHISHALHTFPFFLGVGFRPQPMRPLAVEDLAQVMVAALVGGRLAGQTVAITGPEEVTLNEAVRRIMRATGKRRPILPAPVWFHYAFAWLTERTMKIPLAAKAQVRILSESLVDPAPFAEALPDDLKPKTPFSEAQIVKGLPAAGSFGLKDCLWSRVRGA